MIAVHPAIPRRPFREGVELSVPGFGGIIVCGMEQRAANVEAASAVERAALLEEAAGLVPLFRR